MLALIVFFDPERNINLLVALIISKGIYSAFTAYFYYIGELHWFYRVFGMWDSTYAFIFLLFVIHLTSPDLTVLNSGEIRQAYAGRARRRRSSSTTH